MIVGSVRVRMLVRHSRSLKDKRQVVRSIVDKMRANWNVSVSEVDEHDHLQLFVLGIAQVGRETHVVRQNLLDLVEQLRRHPIAEFVDYELDLY
jgi:uncharacterized protein YlxP (DUF503 family)